MSFEKHGEDGLSVWFYWQMSRVYTILLHNSSVYIVHYCIIFKLNNNFLNYYHNIEDHELCMHLFDSIYA